MNATAYLAEIATALLTYAVHSAAACTMALVVARVLQGPHQRDILWKTALAAPLVTTAISLSLSWLRLDLALLARRAHLVELPGRRMMVRVIDNGNGPAVSRQLIDPVTNVMSIVALGVASICIIVALARFVHRRRVLARALAGRSAIGNSGAIRLTSADALYSPIALGGNEVCLPSAVVNDFSAAQRETLIAHELAHLARRDPLWFHAVELLTALSAFQPLVFVVAHAFRRDVELICDEAAVHATGDRHALVGALALLAMPFDAHAPVLGAATAHDGSPLVMRAARIASLHPGERSRPLRRGPIVIAAGLVGLLCALPVVSSAPNMNELPARLGTREDVERRIGRRVTVDSVVTGHSRRIRVLIQ